jgi:hypothetical protein
MMAVTSGYPTTGAKVKATPTGAYRAYQILCVAFFLAPIAAGADKFFNYLTDWEQYLSPLVTRYIPAVDFMRGVGVVEIAAGILVAISPRVGAYVVALWLAGIIINLVSMGTYYDIALRDFGLLLGAVALGELAQYYKTHAKSDVQAA